MTGASAALVAANWPAAAQTAAMAQQAASDQTPYAFLTAAQAIEIEAMAEQIFPTTDTPGAKEANAIYFIDMALVTFAKSSQDVYTKGLNDLQTQTKTLYPDSVTLLDHHSGSATKGARGDGEVALLPGRPYPYDHGYVRRSPTWRQS